MFIELMVTECDFTGSKFGKPVKGAGAVARGASGRWCVVMWIGPEEIAERDIKVISDDEARAIVERDHPGDWCDF